MKSPNTSTQDSITEGSPQATALKGTFSNSAGFTMIETIFVIALIGFIAVIGMIIGLDSFQRYNLRADLDRGAILLQKARSSAINNIGESKHGVYFGDANKFVLFRGNTYDPSDSHNINIEKNPSAIVTLNPTTPQEITFNPLSGKSQNVEVTITDGVRTIKINVNGEGMIDW